MGRVWLHTGQISDAPLNEFSLDSIGRIGADRAKSKITEMTVSHQTMLAVIFLIMNGIYLPSKLTAIVL